MVDEVEVGARGGLAASSGTGQKTGMFQDDISSGDMHSSSQSIPPNAAGASTTSHSPPGSEVGTPLRGNSGGGEAGKNDLVSKSLRMLSRKGNSPGRSQKPAQRHLRTETDSSMAVLTDDHVAEDMKQLAATAAAPASKLPHFSHRRDITPLNASSLTGDGVALEDVSTEPLVEDVMPPLPSLKSTTRKKSDNSTAAVDGSTVMGGESPVRLKPKNGPLSPIRSKLGMRAGGGLFQSKDDGVFRRDASKDGDVPPVQLSGSFDSLMKRGAGRSAGGGGGKSRRQTADDASISALTLKSAVTAASVETVKHSNKNRSGVRVTSTLSAADNNGMIAARVQTVEEKSGSDGQPPIIPRIVRKTGTKIKRVLRGVGGKSSEEAKSSRPLAGTDSLTHSPLRSRLGSEPAFPPAEQTSGSSRARLLSSSGLLCRSSRSSSTSPPSSPSRGSAANTPRRENIEDAAIRGRLDGLDAIDLGPARYTSRGGDDVSEKSAFVHAPWVIVYEMLRASGGKVPPEIILEGYMALGEDRWVVRLEETKKRYEEKDREGGGGGGGNDSHATEMGNSVAEAVKAAEAASSDASPAKKTDDGVAVVTKTSSSPASQSSGNGAIGCRDFIPCFADAGETLSEEAAESGENNATPSSQGVSPNFQPPQLQLTDGSEETEKDDRPSALPTYPQEQVPDHILLAQMWGKDNPPPPEFVARLGRRSSAGKDGSPGDEEDIMSLAAASCPVDIDEDVFIIDDAKHLRAVHDIAASALKDRQFDTALSIFNKILRSLQHGDKGESSKKRVIGSTYHNIAIVHMWAGEFEESLASLEKAVSTRVVSLPENHPAVAVSRVKLGIVQFALEQYNEAIRSFDCALDIRRSIMNCDQLEMGKILNNIGCCYYQMGDSIEALKNFTSALDIQRIWLEGPVRRENVVYDTSCTLSNMGKLYLEREDYDMSFYVYEESLLLQTSAFKKDHDIVLQTLGSLAFAKAEKGDRIKALLIYKGILRSQIAKHGSGSREAVETEGLMGSLYVRQRSYGEALKCFQSVLTWQTANLPDWHPSLKKTRLTVEKLQKEYDGSFI